MTDSALIAPNSRWLSDSVIGSVRQRNKPSSRSVLDKRKHYFGDYATDYDGDVSVASGPCAGSPYRSTGNPKSSIALSPNDNRPLRRASDTRMNWSTTGRNSRRQQNDSELNAEDALKLHRERRRLSQIRYRNKLRNYADALDEEVQVLREKVQKLESKHCGSAPRVIARTSPWNVVTEYFRLFRYALTAYVPVAQRCIVSSSSERVYESRAHRDFLHKTMSPGVIIDDDHGVEMMLERWRMVSISQPNYEVQVTGLENGPAGRIIATTKTNIIMCKKMLDNTFPHLANSDRGRCLAAKLLGQRFEVNGSTVFSWDDDKAYMVSVLNKSNVMALMIRFLGNLEDVAFLFDDKYSRLLCRRLLCPSG
ncbi:BZIP transcription factor [Phytophthora cinnamomi]|uniref:BZIP transcription factor n=1 Tax=Phytophthora cinnamomi TaxID=4785 RepID=UPI00355A5D65|nr:BZIP transcription factor [Phytophthora cinnamomi]